MRRVEELTERASTRFTLKVTAGGEVLLEKDYPLDILPYDFWLGSTCMPETISSFIMPNHPAVKALVVEAAEILKDSTGSSALTEYQSGNPNEEIGRAHV